MQVTKSQGMHNQRHCHIKRRVLTFKQCDERRPRCSLCIRYSAPCVYPASNGSSTVRKSLVSSGSLVADIPKDLSNKTTDLQVQDLELLHHWTVSACHGFGDKPEDVKPWQVEMPQVACNQPFLMRGILAVSALHMSRVLPDKSQEYLVRAVHHHNLALPSYRYIIEDLRNKMTEENCHAVIGFASLTSAYTFAEPHPLETTHIIDVSPRKGVPEWLHLLRGARQILDVGKHWISKGPMAFQVRSIQGDIDLSCNPEDYRLAALETLVDGRDSSCPLPEREMEAYRITLRLLRESAAIPLQPSQTFGIKLSLFRWVELIPQVYLELLGELRPHALILLAHFCILLGRSGAHYWYMAGAAERLISAIQDNLDEEWWSWIAWPLQMVSSNTHAL